MGGARFGRFLVQRVLKMVVMVFAIIVTISTGFIAYRRGAAECKMAHKTTASTH